jgi:integrase
MKHSIKVTLAKSASDLKPIRLRVSFNSYRVDLSTGLSYEEKNFKDGKAKNNTKNANRQSAVEVNSLLNKQIAVIDNYFIQCELDNRFPLPDELKRVFYEHFRLNQSGGKKIDVFVLFDKFLLEHEAKKQLSLSCITNYKMVKTNLQQYNNNLYISNLTPNFINDFKAFLENKKLKNTTIKHYCSMLKTFLLYLKKERYINFDVEDTDTIKVIKKDTQSFLTHEELKQFYNLKTSSEMETYVKDMFLFACFTGLRFSDLEKLKKSDIKKEHIEIITQKTSTKINIDLNRYSKEIINKYFNINDLCNTLFPKISIKYYNTLLRNMFIRAGIDSEVTITFYKKNNRIEETKKKYEILSSHSARRTFVVECLRKGIAPLVIIKWTGHSNLETLRPYIAIVDELKKSEMQKFDEDL